MHVLPPVSNSVQGADVFAFLTQLEATYAAEMRDLVKHEMGSRALVTCSQAGWDGLAGELRESNMDYADMHAYWQHPQFPGAPWSTTDWVIGNTAMVADTNGGTLAALAATRIAGMPYTVSEYNHPAPNEFAAETLPFLAGFAASQDWDGIVLFDYDHTPAQLDDDHVSSWFATDKDPNKMAYAPAAAALFLGGAMTPDPVVIQEVQRSQIDELLAAKHWASAPRSSDSGGATAFWRAGRTAVQFTEGPAAANSAPEPVPDSGFRWSPKDPSGPRLGVSSPTAQFLVGYAGGFGLASSALTVVPDVPGGFESIALCSCDGREISTSQKLLLTAASRFENVGAGWNPARTSVGGNWGTGPMQARVFANTLTVRTQARAAKVFALDPTGARREEVPCSLANGRLTFRTEPSQHTVWYEIEAEQGPEPAKP